MFYPSPGKENNSTNIYFMVKHLLQESSPLLYPNSSFLRIWFMYDTSTFIPHPHCLYKITKAERKAPWALLGQDTPLSSNVLSDLAYKLLNFLNFTFPCCSHHLRSQRRKGKSTRPGNSDSDPHRAPRLPTPAPPTPAPNLSISQRQKGEGLGHIPKSSQSGGPCKWEQPEEHHPFT